MKLRLPLAAAAALSVAAVMANPAFAIEQIYIPDASAAQNSGPPDALFDKSVPTTWQEKANEQQQQAGGGNTFHFSVSSGNDMGQSSSSNFGEDATVPGSEFHQNGVPLQDPYFPQH